MMKMSADISIVAARVFDKMMRAFLRLSVFSTHPLHWSEDECTHLFNVNEFSYIGGFGKLKAINALSKDP